MSALIAGRNGISAWILHSRALDLAGFLPDDIVLVDQTATPEPGDIVMAEVHDWKRGHATTTVLRVLQRSTTVDLLVARSTDAELVPMIVDRDRVVIRGVILPHRLRAAT